MPISTVRAICLDCGHNMPFEPMQLKCTQCGSEWLDATYDYDTLRQTFLDTLDQDERSLWRYRELLPVRDPNLIISLGEGGTPLIPLPNLSLMLGRPHLFAKDERQNPSTSFKDRQAAVAVSIMKEAGLLEAVVASTGNVAIAYASYCARAGIKLYAFLTSLVPPEKMRECALYGAQVIKVATTYDQSKELAQQFSRQRRMYYDRGLRSIASVESMKTLAYEVAEQLGLRRRKRGEPGTPWMAPDWYIQSVSGGLGPVGTMKGFRELHHMGLIDKVPALACIQVDGCQPMITAFRANSDTPHVVPNPRTKIATLATGSPGRAYTLLKRHIAEFGGTMDSVSDDDAFRAMHVMAKMEGLSMEPASAVAFAGLFKLVQNGVIGPNESVVVCVTGHTVPVYAEVLGEGWAKDVELPQTARPRPEGIMAALDALDERVRSVAIVDDTPDARRLLRRVLQAKGEYQIYEAANGRAGLELIREKRPNLVLLDLMMPEMDGFAVLDEMRADETIRDIPVIVITAKTLTPEEQARLSAKAESLLQKGSFMDDELLDDVLHALS